MSRTGNARISKDTISIYFYTIPMTLIVKYVALLIGI